MIVTVAATKRSRPDHACWAQFDEAVRLDAASGNPKLLRQYADAIGTTPVYLAQTRYVAKQWPEHDHRAVVPWNVLAALAPMEDRFELKEQYAAWPPFVAWKADDSEEMVAEETCPPVEDFLDELWAIRNGQHR